MGFLLILLVVCAGIAYLSIWIFEDNPSFVNFSALVAAVVSIIGLIASVISLFLIGVDVLYKDVNIREAESDRIILIRMLNEDYNSDNLKKSLEFNKKMNGCRFRQNTTLWKYFGTDGACVDTIEIPTGKFIPTQQIRILTDSVAN